MTTVTLNTGDATELVELIQFVRDWLTADAGRLGESLSDFVGSRAYDTVELRADLDRFVFLLGGSDGEVLFSEVE